MGQETNERLEALKKEMGGPNDRLEALRRKWGDQGQ
jgi:hypothetical protein